MRLDAMKTMIRRPGAAAGVSLWKRRAWYAGEDGDGESDSEANKPPTDAQEISNLPGWAQELIKGLRKEAGDHRVKARQEAEARAAVEAARLAEEGKYRELWEKASPELERLKIAAERAAALEAKIQETNEGRIKRIPQQWHSAIPTGYTPEQLSAWLDANEQLFAKPAAPRLDGGAGGEGPSAQPIKLTELQKQMATAAGMSLDEYAKYLQKRQQQDNTPSKLTGG